MKIRVVIGRCS